MSVYAVSDLHGCIKVYQKIKEIIKPEDKVICLGDCGDRGPFPWDTIKAVYTDPQFTYLKGNHEDMLVKAAIEYFDDTGYVYNQRILHANGGFDTLEALINTGFIQDWAKALQELPLYDIYTNPEGYTFFLSHAGFTPTEQEIKEKKIKRKPKDLMWNRSHYILDNWWTEDEDKNIVVHGHTPISLMIEDMGLEENCANGALWYCNNHKVCIDCGTVWTGKTVLLNLDTLDEHVFSIE